MKPERGLRYKEKLSTKLFSKPEEREQFLNAFSSVVKSPALYWTSSKYEVFNEKNTPTFIPDFVSFLEESERPGKHELHEKGAFYVVDQSSALLCSTLSAIPVQPDVIVDLCASPGGKSIFSSLFFDPVLLIANEVVEKRAKTLISNFSRCKIKNAIITCQSVQSLSNALKHSADLVILDAPCSGQSLCIKGEDVDNPFHPATVSMNAMRQRKLLIESKDLLTPKGTLAYLTCTYSIDENEKNIDWFIKKNPEFKTLEVPFLDFLKSPHSKHHCYRLHPSHGFGAGGFVCLLARDDQSIEKQDMCLESLRVFWRSTEK